MRPTQGTYDFLCFIISAVSICYQVSVEFLQKFFRRIPIPGSGIVEERCLEFFACGTADDPDKRFTAGFFPSFFIALDPGLIHMEYAASH